MEQKGKDEIGNRLVSLMKPDIGAYLKAPWKGIPLLRDALALPPMVVRRAASQQIVDLEPDVTRPPDTQVLAHGRRSLHYSASGDNSRP